MFAWPSKLFTPSELLYYDKAPPFIATLLQSSRSLRKAGKLLEAKRCAQDASRSSQKLGNAINQALSLVYLTDAHREEGNLKSALAACQKAYHIFRRQPSQRQRHNEAVAAYALGWLHQSLGNKLDALEWYQTSCQLFERVEKDWGLVNDFDQVKACTRARNWIEALSGYLTDVQVHTNAGYIWIPIVPLDIEEEKKKPIIAEALNGKLFQVQSLEKRERPLLKSDIVYYYARNTNTGNYVLVKRHKAPVDQEGLGVLKSTSRQDFGRFQHDDKGNINFICADAQIIGGKEISQRRIGYITALLKPIRPQQKNAR